MATSTLPDPSVGVAPQQGARAVGGLWALVAAEELAGSGVAGVATDSPVTAALFDLCGAYLLDADEPPVHAVARHGSIPGTGWLLPVALLIKDTAHRADHTRLLAAAAGAPACDIAACVAYVELAAELFAGGAGNGVAGVAPQVRPPLCGLGVEDALAASRWSLAQRCCPRAVLSRLVDHTPPWVAASAAAVIGLRGGSGVLPPAWRHLLHARGGHLCGLLAEQIELCDRRQPR